MKYNIDTKIVENFLTTDEISAIEVIMKNTDVEINQSGMEHGLHLADYHYIKLYDYEPHRVISNILLPRLQKLLHKDIYIDDCHIMNSLQPYTPHSDTLTPKPREGYKHGWTIIIPLDNYNSNTFIFEEKCNWTKDVQEWVKKEKIKPKNVISNDLYNRYFTHSLQKDFDYLTIHDVFPWRKGWLNATDRCRFHASDNYLAKGLTTKRGIVMWTSLPEDA